MLHQIGAGALGAVYRAYDPEHDRLVAVKLFRVDLPPERVHLLVAELEHLIGAGLIHPGIAAPLASGIDGNAPYLVQEYVAAESLDTLVRDRGALGAADALRVGGQLAEVLDFGAGVGAEHGALHPRDVLISSDAARVTGMGVARALERAGATAPLRRPYSAPERMAGTAWDRRADVFSLAALVHDMLWGRRVAGTGHEAADALTALPGADLVTLGAAFARALATDPADRFSTALEFVAALKKGLPTGPAQGPPKGGHYGESRLPLDEPDPIAAAADIDTIRAPAPAGELAIREVGMRAASPERSRDTDAGPAVAPSALVPATDSRPSIRRMPRLDLAPATPMPPAGLAGADQPPSGSALDRSQSAIWPLVLALGVGLALGFAAGYAVGGHDRPFISAATSPEAPASATARSAPSAPEVTASAVSEPIKTTSGPSAAVEAPKPAASPSATPFARDEGNRSTGRGEAGSLSVRSTPAGASLFVDGRDRGRTPTTVRDLSRGAHRVRVVHEGYDTEERRIVITPARAGQSMSVALTRTREAAPRRAVQPSERPAGSSSAGSMSLDSRPSGAKVFVDGRLVGTTPMELAQIGAGDHAVRLERDGYRPWSSSVRVVAGERNRVGASLER